MALPAATPYEQSRKAKFHQLQFACFGTIVPGISTGDRNSLPPLDESRRIAKNLFRIFFIFTGIATCFYFSLYHHISDEIRHIILYATLLALITFLITLPVALGAALFGTERWRLAAQVHAGLFAAFLLIDWLTSSQGHSSPVEPLVSLVTLFLFTVLLFEWAVIGLAGWLHRRRGGEEKAEYSRVGMGLVVALVGGWLLGAIAWAIVLPPRVVRAAELAAAGQPYCLQVVGRPATAIYDLTGFLMYSPNFDGWVFDFHALLVLNTGEARSYKNWSNRAGAFVPVNESARAGLHLDARAKCQPEPHFARSLSYF